MNEVEIVLSYPHQGHNTGDRLSLPADEAKHLVGAGIALYATVKAATAAGADADAAVTKRRT